MPEGHALVVGGTGMLAEVTLELARRYPAVSVLSRHATAFIRKHASVSNLNALDLDYRNSADLDAGLRSASDRHGPLELAIVWIHSTAPEAPYQLAKYVRGDYYHVLGSSAADPGLQDDGRLERFRAYPLRYHEVILGFVSSSGHARWLTNQEIVTGVLGALEQARPHTIIGTVRPWSVRP